MSEGWTPVAPNGSSGEALVGGRPEATAATQNLHFTYEERGGDDDLTQGDVLAKTPKLRTLLKKVHPYYYHNNDYTHFVVLTQTCDLVRRPAGSQARSPAAPYITLGAVRPLETALKRELVKYQKTPLEKMGRAASKDHRYRMQQFLDRVVNNNDSRYFYLHAEPAYDIVENSCVFLALSIAIRASEHYEMCREARVLGLSAPFQARLGWAVGNQYSRIATEDFVGRTMKKAEWKRERKRQLEELCRWFPDKQLQTAIKRAQVEAPGESAEEVRAFIENCEWKSNREAIGEAAVRVLRGLDSSEWDEGLGLKRLMNDAEFQNLTRRFG